MKLILQKMKKWSRYQFSAQRRQHLVARWIDLSHRNDALRVQHSLEYKNNLFYLDRIELIFGHPALVRYMPDEESWNINSNYQHSNTISNAIEIVRNINTEMQQMAKCVSSFKSGLWIRLNMITSRMIKNCSSDTEDWKSLPALRTFARRRWRSGRISSRHEHRWFWMRINRSPHMTSWKNSEVLTWTQPFCGGRTHPCTFCGGRTHPCMFQFWLAKNQYVSLGDIKFLSIWISGDDRTQPKRWDQWWEEKTIARGEYVRWTN